MTEGIEIAISLDFAVAGSQTVAVPVMADAPMAGGMEMDEIGEGMGEMGHGGDDMTEEMEEAEETEDDS